MLRWQRRALTVWHSLASLGKAKAEQPTGSVLGVSCRIQAVVLLTLAYFMVAALRRSWVSDDALVTFRAVDQLFGGNGFSFNRGERVLGFTNPLWALLFAIPYALWREPYYSALLLGLGVSFASVLVFVLRAPDRGIAALGLILLTTSRAYIDFSTSGLEGPLSHLLLFLFYVEFLGRTRPRPFWIALWVSLALVNRLDSVFLVAAPLVAVSWTAWRARARGFLWQMALGCVPLVVWELFALFYYGFLVPNTAFAKLNSAIPQGELIRQGFCYALESLVNDPATLLIPLVALGLLVSHPRLRREARGLVTALGMCLYFAYVVNIGGDFMAGRFFTPLLAVASVVLVHRVPRLLEDGQAWWMASVPVLLLAVMVPFNPLRENLALEPKEFPASRIVNERAWYRDELALMVNLRTRTYREHSLFRDGREAQMSGQKVVVCNNIGLFGIGAGRGVHIVDEMALTDPLLSRIPFEYREDWRTGHLVRPIPEGYRESWLSGTNLLKDACLKSYYDKLKLVTQAPLLAPGRLSAILELNLPSGRTVKPCGQNESVKVGGILP